ncbi:hypothetical protein N9O65_00880 [Schleiferiaceae bacterium]|nr:hypothetical protein [Schleiferiaceae bacterium]
MKIYIQSYSKNSFLWCKIDENIRKLSDLQPVIITDEIPEGYVVKNQLEIQAVGGNTWRETMLKFLRKVSEDSVLLSFDDLFLTNVMDDLGPIISDFEFSGMDSLKLAHVFRSKMYLNNYRIGPKRRYQTTCAFVIWRTNCLSDLLEQSLFTPWTFEEEGWKYTRGIHGSFARRRFSYINVVDKGRVHYKYRKCLGNSLNVKSPLESIYYEFKEWIKYKWRILNI